MEKILMLGTGNGGTAKLYNTCFVIQNDLGNFLVDTGGSIEILERLKYFKLDIRDINNIFISHAHIDHMMGLVWIFKKLNRYKKEDMNKINIYCNEDVYEAIDKVARLVLPGKLVDRVFSELIDFKVLKDNEVVSINGVDYTFFDIKARGFKQYGFEGVINGKRIVFLGDETITESSYDRVRDADHVMHEAFCLDSEEPIFKAYEKNHATVKSVSLKMNEFNVKTLILYHTEESHDNKKELYTDEGKKYFDGNVIVPNDLEVIEIG